jgi:hypothetical protein
MASMRREDEGRAVQGRFSRQGSRYKWTRADELAAPAGRSL